MALALRVEAAQSCRLFLLGHCERTGNGDEVDIFLTVVASERTGVTGTSGRNFEQRQVGVDINEIIQVQMRKKAAVTGAPNCLKLCMLVGNVVV